MRPVPELVLTLTVLLLVGCAATPVDWLAEQTGEEEPLGQLRGLMQLAGNLLRPCPQEARYEPVANAGVNPFGINTFLEQEVEVWKRERIAEMAAAAGFHWIRQGFPWEDIEIHGPGDFQDRRHEPYRSAWDKYDNIVDIAGQNDLQIIALLSNPPAWSRAGGDEAGTYAPPDDLDDYGDYVFAVASRYQGRISHYQVWNEPNIYPEWGEQPVDPEAYTDLLCLAYRRIKEADAEAVVISGALAQTISLNPGPGGGLGLNDMAFLQRMYRAGAGDCFDVLAVNDYILWSGPTDQRIPPSYIINFSRPLYLRDIMVANGDASKPIWLSEMNSNALPPDHPAPPSYGRVSLEQQARYAPQAYQRVMEEWPWAGVVNFWFFKRPHDLEADQSWYYFRMVEPDFAPLPVYDAMREYTTGLTPTLYPGSHQEDHWALKYTGEWETVSDGEAVLGRYLRAREAGAAVDFPFEGNSLILTPGPGEGQISVSVDGEDARTFELEGRPLRLYSSLIRGVHGMRIEVLEGEVGLDSLTVHETAMWSLTLLGAGLIVVLVAGLYRLLSRRRSF